MNLNIVADREKVEVAVVTGKRSTPRLFYYAETLPDCKSTQVCLNFRGNIRKMNAFDGMRNCFPSKKGGYEKNIVNLRCERNDESLKPKKIFV